MGDQASIAQTTRHPCADIPEFDNYRERHGVVKEALLEETGGEREAFIERAARTIADCVLCPPGSGPDAKDSLLAKLYRQGYSQETVTRALAVAWFDETDTFTLPRRRPNSIWRSGWFLWGLPLVLALLALLGLLDWLRHAYPGQAGAVLWFAPLLGMLGFVIAAVLHGVLKALVGLAERLRS